MSSRRAALAEAPSTKSSSVTPKSVATDIMPEVKTAKKPLLLAVPTSLASVASSLKKSVSPKSGTSLTVSTSTSASKSALLAVPSTQQELSSTQLKAWFKQEAYSNIVDYANAHFSAFPTDSTSAFKFALLYAIHALRSEFPKDAKLGEAMGLLLDQTISIIGTSPRADRFMFRITLGLASYARFRISYESFREKTAKEVERKQKEQERQMRAALAARTGAAADDATDAKDIGDCSPHIGGLNLDRELEFIDELRAVSENYSKSLLAQDRVLPKDYDVSICLMALSGVAELFGLFGLHQERTRCQQTLLALATELRRPDFQAMTIAELLKAGQALSDGEMQLLRANISDLPQSRQWSRLATAAACDMLHRGEALAATQLAGRILVQMGKRDRREWSVGDYLTQCDLKLLLTLCRCAVGSVVEYPAPAVLPASCGGHKLVCEFGALDWGCEAYKDAVIACRSVETSSSRGLPHWARAHLLHLDVLAARCQLYRLTRLGKELRLYSKLRLELAQSLGLTVRTIDAVLYLAEVDILCDEVDQCSVKLSSAESLLGGALLTDGSKRGRAKTNTKDNPASPALMQTGFALPKWLAHVPGQCKCYPCRQPLFIQFVGRFFGLKGAYYHLKGEKDSANEFFDGTLDFVRESCTSVEGIGESALKSEVLLGLLNVLQLQTECLGRDENVKRCRQALDLRKRLIGMLPSQAAFVMPLLNCEYTEHAAFVHQMDQKRQEQSSLSLSKAMSRMALSPLPSNALKVPSISELKTPAMLKPAKQKDALPTRPRKKLLPPPT